MNLEATIKAVRAVDTSQLDADELRVHCTRLLLIIEKQEEANDRSDKPEMTKQESEAEITRIAKKMNVSFLQIASTIVEQEPRDEREARSQELVRELIEEHKLGKK